MRRLLVSAVRALLAGSVVAACRAPGATPPSEPRPPPPTSGASPAAARAATPGATSPTPLEPSSTATGTAFAAGAALDPAAGARPFDGDWGGSGPVALAAAAPDGRWLAVCEARADTNGDGRVAIEIGKDGAVRGDAFTGHFIERGGLGQPIEAFVGSDPSGRWVALVRSGQLVLRDTTTSAEAALDADLRDDSTSFGPSRIGSFDPTGRRFLYTRPKGQTPRLVVRELIGGTETEIDPGPGDPHRAELDPTGEWVTIRVAVDSSGNGRIDWPVRPAAPFMRCNLPVPRFAAWNPPRDEVVTRVARVGDVRPAGDAPGLVVPFGDALVIREADGALVRVRPDGSRQRLVEAACAAKVLHAAPERGALLVTCQKKNGRMDARLLVGGASRSLGIELGVAAQDRVLAGAPRLVALHPGADAVLVDLDGGKLEKLELYDRIVATSGANALVVRRKRLLIRSLGGGEQAVAGDVTPFGHVRRAGSVVALSPSVIDVGERRVLGTFSTRPLAVATDGRLLVASRRPPDSRGLAQGPLRWVPPDDG